MFPEDVDRSAREVLELARAAGVRLATVESCTGGLIAGALTAVPGSSDVVDRGFVTYSNVAKTALVGVPAELIAAYGAVSEPVARRWRTAAYALAGSAGRPWPSPAWPARAAGVRKSRSGFVHFAGGESRRRHRFTVMMRFGDIGRDNVRLESVRVRWRC